MVAPQTTVSLKKRISLVLTLPSEGLEVKAEGIPVYWRGPYLGMKISPASPAELTKARQIVQALEARANDRQGANELLGTALDTARSQEEGTDAGEAGEAPVLEDEPTATSWTRTEAPADASRPEQTPFGPEQVMRHSAPPAPRQPTSSASTPRQPIHPDALPSEGPTGSHLAALDERQAGDDASSFVPHPGGPQPAASPPLPAAGSPAAIPPLPELRGETSGKFTVEALLNPFPQKGGGLPLPDNPSLYAVLSTLAAHEATGELEIIVNGEKATLFVRQGVLASIDPLGQSFDDFFIDVLKNTANPDPKKLDEAIAYAQAFNKPLAVALYEKRVVPMDLLGRELRRVKLELFTKLIALPSPAKFRFRPRAKFSRKFDPIRIFLISGLVDFVQDFLATKYFADISPLLEPFRFKFVQVVQNELVTLDMLSLNEKQKHAVQFVLHGPNRLNDVYSLSLLTRHGTARLVLMLHHFRLINWLDQPGEVEGQETIEQVLQREFRSLDGVDHFQRLGVHWAAHPKKLEPALEKFKKKYAPGTPLSNHSEEARELCAKIMNAVQESYDYLSDQRRRRAYRQEIQGDARIRRAAEFLLKQADLRRFRGEWDEAMELLESAIDLVDSARYRQVYKVWSEERKRK